MRETTIQKLKAGGLILAITAVIGTIVFAGEKDRGDAPPQHQADPPAALYHYRAKTDSLASVYDGDTINGVEIDLGFDLWLRGQKLRILRIDTPEMRGGTAESKAAAREARDALRRLLDQDRDGNPDPAGFIIRSQKPDSFGRILCEVYAPDPDNPGGWVNASDYLLEAGFAKPYED